MSEIFLSVENLTVRFAGIVALDGLSFRVEEGEICGLIGPNGAGKTTLFNALNGLVRPSSGAVRFRGADLTRVATHGIARLGIARTFQHVALFDSLSVRDNIATGAHSGTHSGYWANILRTRATRREEDALQRRVDDILALMELEDVAGRPTDGLPFGVLKRVELGRAMALGGRLLLLDEPAGGLNHEEVEALKSLIGRIRDRGWTVLLVEHHLNLVMSVADHVVAMDFGRKIADGPPDEVQRDPAVVEAYLGANA